MAAPTLIYCAGKNRTFDAIALEAGYQLGAQLPCNTYFPLAFADQDWRKPNRTMYMAALADHRPAIATVLDFERPEQRAEVLDWAEEAAQYVQHVVVVPKAQQTIGDLPRAVGGADIWLGYSVPTRFAGTPVPVWEFLGWPVHLLGGSPHAQMRLAQYLDVRSADGNMANKMAQRCRYWRQKLGPKGHWIQLGDWPKDGNAEAFRRSCHNIMAAWKTLAS